MARQVLENGVILPAEYSDDWYDDMTSNLTKLDDVIGSDSEKLSSTDVGAAALSNNYNDLDNLPTIPTVNDAVLTIQKNGVDVQTFTANASSNVTANITVPTKTSDLTNDSDFVDISNPAVSSGITSAKVSDYDTHIADTDIHVTTADKNRWNNQTYVFRYSSTALTASSTNSNTLLDNTDNLKVGDKVIDSSGVLFSITAIDTANSTFTVGTALIDLANDSDVVHKSGDETVNGIKNFKDLIPIDGDYLGDESSNNQRTNICLRSNRDTAGKSCAYISRFRQNRAQGALQTGDLQMIGFDVLENEVRTNNVFSIQCSGWVDNVPTKIKLLSTGSDSSFGSSIRPAKINDLNPGALGMPDLSNGIDISSYFDINLYTGQTYTPIANGWISISITSPNRGSLLCESVGISQTAYGVTDPDDNNKYRVSILVPCQASQTLTMYIRASGGTVNFAKFYPCLGNV